MPQTTPTDNRKFNVIILYYGHGNTETETIMSTQEIAYKYADELKRERHAQSYLIN